MYGRAPCEEGRERSVRESSRGIQVRRRTASMQGPAKGKGGFFVRLTDGLLRGSSELTSFFFLIERRYAQSKHAAQ